MDDGDHIANMAAAAAAVVKQEEEGGVNTEDDFWNVSVKTDNVPLAASSRNDSFGNFVESPSTDNLQKEDSAIHK